MNVADKEKSTCTGCSACCAICDAIAMEEDSKGFSYPKVDATKCNNCGKCKNKCPQENKNTSNGYQEIYAFKHVSEEVRKESTSGGVFTALSDIVLEQNGVIYGAAFEEDFTVNHIRATDAENRDKMRGSKYVKSEIAAETYRLVKADLDSGKQVLFSGTPCQIAALEAFLNKDYTNLITVDLVCHGTPSNKFLKDYLCSVEKKTSKKIHRIRFRAKITGWHQSKFVLYDENNKMLPLFYGDVYMKNFLNNNLQSPACYSCKYSNYNRISDITMADFWGIEKSLPHIDDNKGVSLVLVNSAKGKELFEKAAKDSQVYVSNKEDSKQIHLLSPLQKPENYSEFWNEILSGKDVFKVALKYSGITRKERIKNKIKCILQKIGLL